MASKSIQDTRKRLLTVLKRKSFKKKRVVLASGKVSNYYFDGRITSLSSEGAYCIGKIILDMLKKNKIDAIGGLTLGADPIIGAVSTLSFKTKNPINGFIVRKETKKYGMQNLIEGTPLKKSSRVVIVDDVVTTGSSTIKAIEAVQKLGCKIVRVIAVVDRLEGAKENIAKCGLELESIFTIKNFKI
ncbi:MAG: orotate phosphoribosyltransferase [PVC group bacterium]|nr:orotate phosphoribosyltransferase [PVC group bacterium]